jgi:hypothetical protein
MRELQVLVEDFRGGDAPKRIFVPKESIMGCSVTLTRIIRIIE